MDGISFVKEIYTRSEYQAVPVVMLTTESHEKKKFEGQAAGANALIVKSFQSDQLLKVVSRFIQH